MASGTSSQLSSSTAGPRLTSSAAGRRVIRPRVRPLPPGADRDIDTVSQLQALLHEGRSLSGLRLQGLDLSAVEPDLLARDDAHDLVVLGGRLSHRLEEHLRAHGAIIFPPAPHAPVPIYRGTLYTGAELYAGLAEHGYAQTPDARAYAWLQDAALRHDAYVTVLRAIHDDAMSDALVTALAERPAVGVMGGHAVARGTEEFAAAARLGNRMADAGLVVLTGGGPGAMEAANLGAWCRDESVLDQTLLALAAVPRFSTGVGPWAQVALDARERAETADPRAAAADPAELRTLGVPTWYYGHEPPNVFGDRIAKFFSNALREDLLLQHSTAGLVVLPGAAGTVQEVFQMATRLYYAADPDPGPLVLVDERHWTQELPVWPLLEALGAGRPMGDLLHLVDSVGEAATVIEGRR